MAGDPRVRQLLEQLLDSGSSPEAVCRDCPELLPEVRERWRRVRTVEAQVEALFPESRSTPGPGLTLSAVELPKVSGYDVQMVLGRGGMGVVFKAWHHRLHRPVALKMLLAGECATLVERERFLREAEAVAGLRHPHVVQVHDAGDHDGRPYFTMEFVEGGSLAEQLAGTPQPAHRAATVLAALADAVHVAHEGGIVHRDLKPSNVLLTADGTPKVSDFGLARRLEGAADLTRSGAPVGTPSYMAPEQARGHSHAAGPAADLYALGAILYECLTGRPPFRAETGAETLLQVMTWEPVPPSRLNARVPRDLETICLKCLQKAPDRRYPTAAALADDLRRFLAGAPITARRAGAVERAGRWARRHPTVTFAVAVAVLLTVTAAGAGWWRLAERAATVRAAEEDLREAADAQRQAAWPAARTALERAKVRLGDREAAGLRARIGEAEQDLELAARLDGIRMNRGAAGPRTFNWEQADRDYLAAFAAAGLGAPGDPPDEVAGRIRGKEIAAALVAALDDWAICAREDGRRDWVLAVARHADPGPAWHDRVRDPAVWYDAAALADLARDPPLDDRSVSLLLVFGRLMDYHGADAAGFLRRVHWVHPGDFWVNFALAELLGERRDPDAVGYYRAALAVRPTAVAVYVNLGRALSDLGRVDEAMDHWRHALRLAPDAVTAHYNLAVNHLAAREFDQTVLHARHAVRIDPENGQAHAALGQAFLNQGRFAEAESASDRALALMPKDDPVRTHATNARARSRRMLALAPRVDAVRRGDERPANGREGIDFAEYFNLSRHYATAARVYADALARDPALTDDPARTYRYDAACAAAAAATGAGEDAAQLRSLGRAILRAWAFGWLRAECDAFNERYPRTSPAGQVGVARRLRDWWADDDLAGVRGEALTALPEGERGRWEKLWADIAGIAARDPATTVPLARAQAGRRQWALAAAGYAQAFRLSPTDDGEAWFEYAAVQLLSGDRAGYRRTCDEMRRRSRLPEMRSYHVARAGTLAIDSGTDVVRLQQLSEPELRRSASAFWSLTEQGALHCRAGRHREAVPLLEQSLRAERRPGAAVLNWLWLSLATSGLGRPDEARRWLGQADDWLGRQGTELPANARALGLHLHDWLEAHVLRREAEAVIRAGAPAAGGLGW